MNTVVVDLSDDEEDIDGCLYKREDSCLMQWHAVCEVTEQDLMNEEHLKKHRLL